MKVLSLTNWIADIIAKRKAAQLLRVVDATIALAEARSARCVPLVFRFYRQMAAVVVTETETSPDALYELLAALDKVAKQYGPRLKAAAAEFADSASSSVAECEEEQGALVASINELNVEVQS